MQDPLLGLPPKPDLRSTLIVVLIVLGALCMGWLGPWFVQPIAAAFTDCDFLPSRQSGLFIASCVGSAIALATSISAVVFRAKLNSGWRVIPPRYELLRQLYLGAAGLLFLSGLYIWHDGYRISFGEGCDASFGNPWAFLLKLSFVAGSWFALANTRLMLRRVHLAHTRA